ncbi:MAG: type II toxin-antitoxin system Phd/YefM family antitoxin [Deltaproteobacteria bacterium]|nr:MAG: type II toxin-antitoxin system Phd/YefM family antitoxin [Deltaproteobacteria bacterium]
MKEESYSTYQAKAQLSKLLRQVRNNKKIVITHHGRPVARLVPFEEEEQDLEQRLRQLTETGIIEAGADDVDARFAPLGRSPGALDRFLAERD